MKRNRRFLVGLRSAFAKRRRSGLQDPELMLTRAQEEMQAMHARNRERAVQANTQKDWLQEAVAEGEKRALKLEGEAAEAEAQGQARLVAQIRSEQREVELKLVELRQKLGVAEQRAEAVQIAIRREEMRIRESVAEALALKAQLKSNEIQRAMNRALEGIQGIESADSAYARAAEKIRSSLADREARAEMGRSQAEGSFDERETAKYIFAKEDERSVRESKNRLIQFALLVVILVLIVLLIVR